MKMPSFKIRINGSDQVVNSSDPDQPLLYVLRNIGLTAAKFGCGLGQCGACSVLIDGRSERSCVMTIAAAEGRAITTLEGLGSAANPSTIQSAFINENVPQCGYCTSGMIVSATALLSSNPKPTPAQVNAALDGNLCRCGSHPRVVRAVMAASGQAG
jgi:nicotinate dehydrogenase subunit A